MIEIKQLNKTQLIEYVNSDKFGSGDDIPITFHRACSQAKNPRLNENDIILLLAVEDDVLIGYLGILPDEIHRNNKQLRMGWLSCLWASSKVRGRGVGLKLIAKAMELWNNNLLTADYVAYTKKIYDRTNQFMESPFFQKGVRLYIKSDLCTLLPPKNAIFSRIGVLLKIADLCINILLSFRLLFFRLNKSNLNFEYIDHIDDEVNEFILARQGKELFKRSKEDLDWIINNPWVLSREQKEPIDKKYHFSSSAKSFNFYALKIRNSAAQLVGFIVFSKRDHSLKIPYLYHDNCIDSVVEVLNHHLIKWGVKTFTTFNAELTQRLLENKTLAIVKREQKRFYMVSLSLKEEITKSDMNIQDGDGDSSFT